MKKRPGDEIGKHVRLKIVCRKACGFKSHPGHHFGNSKPEEAASLRSATSLY